ncbi:MAG: flagellar biosynthetic protein FliR [Pseudomonadota bacterium]
MQIELLMPYAITFGLILVRCGGAFMLIPTLGGESIPVQIRGGIAAVVALTLTPIVGPMEMKGFVALIMAGAGEMLMGLAIGLVLRMILMTAEFAGGIAGLQMGLSFSQVVDPLTQESSVILSQAMGMIALMIMLAVDGHHMVLSGLRDSLVAAPPGTVLPNGEYVVGLIPLLSVATTTGMRIASPIVVTLLLSYVSIGLLARAAPQLNLLVFGFSISILVGLVMLSNAVWPGFSLIADLYQRVPQFFTAVLGS